MSSIEIFRGEIGVRPARIDPLTQDWRLAAVLFTGPALLPCYHVGFYAYCLYRSGYRFRLQSLLNITGYVVLVFRRIFHWFLTYALRLRDRAEGETGGPPPPPPTFLQKQNKFSKNLFTTSRRWDCFCIRPAFAESKKSCQSSSIPPKYK